MILYSESSFWDVSTVHTKPFNESTGEATVPAHYTLSNVKMESKTVEISIGPIIGKVTTSSVCILIESAKDAYLAVSVMDQTTGRGYEMSRYFIWGS